MTGYVLESWSRYVTTYPCGCPRMVDAKRGDQILNRRGWHNSNLAHARVPVRRRPTDVGVSRP